MNNNISETLISALNWRYATKKYDASKKIPASEWNTIQESMRLSASSYGLQPWKFIDVQNPDVRKKLTPVSWGQTQIEDASHLVALTTLKTVSEAYVEKFIQSIAKTRGAPAESLQGYKDMMVQNIVKGGGAHTLEWTRRQAYIAMGSALQTAALLKVDATPIEGISPAEYDKILGLEKTDYATVAVIAFGYRHADDGLQHAKKVRFSTSDVFSVI